MPTTKSAPLDTSRLGLLADSGPIPLEGVSVDADLTDLTARVVFTQRYRNVETRPIEAVYVFPVDERAAICGFEAIVNGVEFKSDILPRDRAFKRYDDALQEGHGAFLLDEERADVFTASVGNVLPGAEVLLRITYVCETVLEANAVRFTLPTTVSPRYAPVSDRTGVGRTDAVALNPEVRWTVPYGLDLTIRAAMPGRVTAVQSPSHPIAMSIDGHCATVTLAQTNVVLDRDVVVLIEAEGMHTPHVRVERHPSGQHAAALALYPTFKTDDAPSEVVFVVDRSGSMEGSSIAEVRNALQLCLRSLVSGCRFNIVGFGSTYETLFDASRPYDDRSLADATRHVSSLEANLGGTEILGALQFVLSRPLIEGLPRQVVIMTDGDVTNTDMVLAEIGTHAHQARVFTFGIGRGASAHLVRGMARVGRGVAEFIHPGERVEPKVLRQFSRLLAPALNDVRIDWGGLDVTMVPSVPPPMFAGERAVVYAFVAAPAATTIGVSAQSATGPVSFSARLDPASEATGTSLAALTARERIRELEEQPETAIRLGSRQLSREGDPATREIVRLSTTFGVASRETSFVAIERRPGAAPQELELRRIPVALRSGWGGKSPIPSPPPVAMASSSGDSEAMPHMASRSLSALRPTILQRIENALGRKPGASAPSVSRPLPPTRQRPLDDLVALQHADGSWTLTDDLAALVGLGRGLRHALLTSSRPVTKLPQADELWATVLALVWLEKHAAAERDEWSALARKATRWLEARLDPAELSAWQAGAGGVVGREGRGQRAEGRGQRAEECG